MGLFVPLRLSGNNLEFATKALSHKTFQMLSNCVTTNILQKRN